MTESGSQSTAVVLVPGACHGGWWYQPLVDRLEQHAVQAVPLTLAGLDPESTEPIGGINLEDHVEQVRAVAAALAASGSRVVLVGHSYGGSVITGAADRAAAVSALVYLDAFVPDDGDSCYSMTNDDQRDWYIAGSGMTGIGVEPLPFFDSRARPQPLGTLIQKSRLTGAWQAIPHKFYVAATEWPGGTPFVHAQNRVRTERGWDFREWKTRHNVLHDGPDRVLDLLLEVNRSLGD